MDALPIVKIRGLDKNFGPTQALKKVDMDFYPGEIRGLIGENGSGKSTVTSIMAGMQKPSAGEMFYKGEKWAPASMAYAQEKGICMILQEANTISGVSVAENIFLNELSKFTKFGFLNRKKLNEAAQAKLNAMGLQHIKAKDPIDKYTFEDRKLIEIVRCVDENTTVLVVDETTTALSVDGRQMLYKIVHQLAKEGKSIVFISHDMDEIIEQCDVLTVLRDGNIIGHLDRKEMAVAKNPKTRKPVEDRIRLMMVGRDIGDAYYREDYDSSCSDEVALEFKDVSVGGLEHFNLKVHKGEIVGFGGLSDCGMRLVGRAGFGLEKLKTGEVVRNGKVVRSAKDAIAYGVGYISKNRDTEALILPASIKDNIALPSLREIAKASFVSPFKVNKLVSHEIDAFRIKARNSNALVSSLSGGNKQKVSFGKWTGKDSDVIIMDCPTRGVDIGVKQSMYADIAQMKKEGKAIIMISEELSELVGMSDRIIIMKDNKVTKEFKRSKDLKEADIIGYMI